MSRKDELLNIISIARTELFSIEEEERKETLNNLIGRCYESKKYNTFYRIIGINENLQLKVLSFIYYDNGSLGAFYDYLEDADFINEITIKEITQQQFYGQWLIFLTKINVISF